MLQAIRRKGPQAQVVTVKSYPSPIGGWNRRDALAAMKPTDAVDLVNWFPRTTYVEIRGGYSSHATGLTNNGKTLSVYNAINGVNKMFCATSAGVYDVSSAGAVGAAVASRTDGKHQWLNYGDGTNNYLIMFNGVDKGLYYDGTSWIVVDASSSPALTGLATTSIIGVHSHKDRLYFIQKNSMSFWYLTAGVAGGALTEFNLGGVAQEGGYLMAMGTWTIDGGDGPDDRAVFITSEGEAIVYAGTNPSSAADWALIGRYKFGRPIGRRCMSRYGGDLLLITQNGVFPMSAAAQSATIDYKLALSFKIEQAFNEASLIYGSNFGWKCTLFPAQSALIINVPHLEDGTHEQYVMNTITKSWCKFNAWDAEDFSVINGELYFCRGTAVYKSWDGTIDGSNAIEAYAKTAFSYFGNIGQLKKFKMFRPVLSVNGNISYLTDIDVDFKNDEITGTASYSVTSGARWDIDNWDEAYWAAGLEIVRDWTSPDEWDGFCAAGKLKVSNTSLVIQWMASDYTYERGGVL